ncbi:MAG: hypothetical protein JRE12_19435 [Deltaproteobacteria bacterium]|nr:hypothetical protein [Deltaproteobacteria bacterium]
MHEAGRGVSSEQLFSPELKYLIYLSFITLVSYPCHSIATLNKKKKKGKWRGARESHQPTPYFPQTLIYRSFPLISFIKEIFYPKFTPKANIFVEKYCANSALLFEIGKFLYDLTLVGDCL